MRNISPELSTHLAGEVTSLGTCWLITRTDGVIMAFTDHDRDIDFEDVIYISISGFTPTAIESKNDLSVDNMEVEGILAQGYITAPDLLAGLYDFAQIEIFLVNVEDITQGRMMLKTGTIGEVTLENNMFKAEIRGLTQHLSQTIAQVYSPTCRAVLGDNKCKVDLATITVSATVTAITSSQIFTASTLTQPAGWFTGGEVLCTAGDNEGLRMEIKEFAAASVVLALPLPYPIAIGDVFNVIAGCDKAFDTCKAKFDNVVNFRGEPLVPGMDRILTTAGTIDREES